MMSVDDDEIVEGAESGLAGVFTRYVQALARRSDSHRDVMTSLFEDVWGELRQVLTQELRRRSLWSSSPSFVGLYGWESWTAELGPSPGPLEEILPDCYTLIFHGQLSSLVNQLKVRPSIDGLVVFHVRNFLTQRQKDHDPLGYRLFEILKAALLDAIDREEIYVLRGSRKIRNNTVLAASPDADPGQAVSVETLGPIVERWNNDLLPGLVTAGGAERRLVVERLRTYLFDLEAEGVDVFNFKNLLDPLKHDVRARWAAIFDEGEGEVVRLGEGEEAKSVVRFFHPSDRLAEIDSLQKLVDCVAGLVERLDTATRTRRYLENLLNFLRRFSFDEKIEHPGSYRMQATQLKIPRERIPGLYKTLGKLIRKCQKTLSQAGKTGSQEGEADG